MVLPHPTLQPEEPLTRKALDHSGSVISMDLVKGNPTQPNATQPTLHFC